MSQKNNSIKIIGLGGAGLNILDSLKETQFLKTERIEYIGFDTDRLTISNSRTKKLFLIGEQLFNGFGTGCVACNGKKAAEVEKDLIQRHLNDTKAIILIAGFGGGTGTGSFPVIAKIAKKMGIYVAGIITKPFEFEKNMKQKCAENALETCKDSVDLLSIVSNQKVYLSLDENKELNYALKRRDILLKRAVLEIGTIVSEFTNNDIFQEIMRSKIEFIGIGQSYDKKKIKNTIKKVIEHDHIEDRHDQNYFLSSILERTSNKYKKIFANIRNCGLSMNEIIQSTHVKIFRDSNNTELMINVCNEDKQFDHASVAVLGVRS